MKFRYHGVIYNPVDSLPYPLREFKIYDHSYVGMKHVSKEVLFRTDLYGNFDITTEIAGVLCWPSYSYKSSTYAGPPPADPTTVTSENVARVENMYYNIYYKPYF
jgi:hypothetical protein